MSYKRWWLPLIVLILLVLGGCFLLLLGPRSGALVDLDQPGYSNGLAATLAPDRTVGQTFVARHAGLLGVEFFLFPQADAPLTLQLHLRTDPQADEDLATAVLDLPPGEAAGFYRFTFPPLSDSHGQYYYAFLDAQGPAGAVALAAGDAYLDGAAYQAHQPIDAQTAFRLVYVPRYVAIDLVTAIAGGIGLLTAVVLLFLVPGWALLSYLVPARHWAWAELFGLAAGVGLALYPLFLLWTHFVGANLGPLYAWLPVIGGLVALTWRYRAWRPRHGWQALRDWSRSDALWPDLALVVVLGLVFGVRLLVTRGLEAPLWGDGYQHTMIAQLLVDHGGLFESYEPYAALDRFTYHFGFHSAVAVLHWLTGLSVVKATIWTGQLLNGLAVLALYPVVLRVTSSRWGAVCAVLLAGLLSPMPMEYVNWGRYTQLAGQVVLLAAVWLTWELVDTPQRHVPLMALTVLVGAGLALTHYRVILFYGVFVVALIFLAHGRRRETAVRLVWIGLGVGLLFLPWLANTVGGNLPRILGRNLVQPSAQGQTFAEEYNGIGRLDTYLSPLWWLVSLLGLALGLWRRQRGVLLMGLWWLLLLLATNPAWFSLPGTGVITNFALFIAVYVPAALFAGNLAAHGIQLVAGRRWALALIAVAIVGLGVWGASERLSDIDPAAYALVTRPDVRAAAWIQDNTPPDARFLVNSFFAYGNSLVVGSDGGWWLPLLAKRQNTVPPLVYGSESQPGSPYRQQLHELARQAQEGELDDPAIIALLQGQGVNHVYVGQRQGRVNYTGENVIYPERLAFSASYDLIYHQDRVWIFAINP